ncbi:hypothetical protein [Brevibacillus sp. SYSU BS000544]|uniref:hypothetical protein n=1 Tax=Brevibacillus sp. SYSU BS000544 TaxID=3416443 RepID=UPI003CE53910
MAKIKLASFRPNKKFKEYISAERLYQIREESKDEFVNTFREHLYCPIIDCPARLRHHRPKNNQGNAYLSTWPKDDHKRNCSYEFERTPGGGVTIVEDVNDPNSVIVINRKRAKELMKRAFNPKYSKKSSNEKGDVGKLAEIVRSKSDPNISQVITFEEDGKNKGRRSPRVRTVDIDELSETLLGKLICLKGPIISMKFGSDYGYINSADVNGNDIFSVVFSERYQVEFPTEFKLMSLKAKENYQSFCCIGRLGKSKATGKYQIYPETPWLVELF